jgi:hypothetical protein
MSNFNSQKTIGLVITILGIALFIALIGTLLFRIIGGIAALMLINYGLQMQGQPKVFFYMMNLFNLRR